ncbi:MAG TPA: ParA family protein [Armatimonadota bacterium]|nr:ParA family protein [Armatimonadota bacterium]
MPRYVAVANEKGGAGKTTTTINLGAALAEVGEKVVLVDLDARADLTLNLGVRLAQDEPSVYTLFADESVKPSDVARKLEDPPLTIVPAERDLAAVEVLLGELDFVERSKQARGLLRRIGRGADWVLIDCPPGLSRLVVAVMECVDWVLVPQQCSFTALHGLRALEETLSDIEAAGGRRRPEVHIVLTMANRTLHSRRVDESVRGRFAEAVFETTIPATVRIQEAPEYALPIISYDPDGKGAEAYRNLAQEVISRAAK